MILKTPIIQAYRGGQGPSTQISSLRSPEPTDGLIVYRTPLIVIPGRRVAHAFPTQSTLPRPYLTVYPSQRTTQNLPIKHRQNHQPTVPTSGRTSNHPPYQKVDKKKQIRYGAVPNSPSAREYPVTPNTNRSRQSRPLT